MSPSFKMSGIARSIYAKWINKFNDFPTHFQIQTINACNGNCIMCPYTKKRKHYMSNYLFKKIIKEISENSKPGSFLTLALQNEPFLDKDLINKVMLIKRYGNIPVGIITNGSLLNQKVVLRLESANIDEIIVSLDTINKERFKIIRPGLDFDKIIENIYLLKGSDLRDKTKIGFIIQNENYMEIKSFSNFWKSKGVKVDIRCVTNRGGALKHFDKLRANMTFNDTTNKYFDSCVNSFFNFCPNPFYRFNILSDGKIIQCCNDWVHKDIIGNLKENSIKEIWGANILKTYRALHLSGQAYRINLCKNCSLNFERKY